MYFNNDKYFLSAHLLPTPTDPFVHISLLCNFIFMPRLIMIMYLQYLYTDVLNYHHTGNID